jgi:multiple sugar transport system substrate-binding protein
LGALAVVLVLVATGCGGDEESSTGDSTTTTTEGATTTPVSDETTTTEAAEPITLTFWNYWDGKNGEVIQALADRYSDETPGVTIENVFVGWADLLPKLQTAASGASAPDLAAGDLVWMPKLAQSGALAPLDDYVASAGIDLGDFYSELLEVNEYDGALFGLPISTNNLELFYNRELFEAAGLDPDTPPSNWDELRAMAATCTDPATNTYGMELYTEPGEGLTWQFQVYLWQAGGEFLTDDLSAAAFNSDAGKKALQYWVDLLHSDESAPLAPWGEFSQGKACMVMDGSWMVGIWSADPPFDFGTAAMPAPVDGQPATNMGGEQGFVFAGDPQREQAAFDFLAWLTSPEIQAEWDRETGFMPVRASVAESPEYLTYIEQTEPRALPFVENQQYARNRPPVSVYPEISDAFSRELEAALLGETSVADALAAAEAAVNELLANG